MALAGDRNKQEDWLRFGRSLPPSVLVLSSSLSFPSPLQASSSQSLPGCVAISLEGYLRDSPIWVYQGPDVPAPLPPNVLLSPAFIIPCACSLGSFCFLCHLVPSGRLELVSWNCKTRVALLIEWAEWAGCLLQGVLSSALRLQSARATPQQQDRCDGDCWTPDEPIASSSSCPLDEFSPPSCTRSAGFPATFLPKLLVKPRMLAPHPPHASFGVSPDQMNPHSPPPSRDN